jgi:uncharacterized membrane protein YsdA (DUF1294 family)/cold shock CspA family protein
MTGNNGALEGNFANGALSNRPDSPGQSDNRPTETAMRYQGHIENWNDDRGFGFVTPNGGGNRAYVHIKAFSSRRRRPVNGDAIIYEIVKDSKNRVRAINVRYKPKPAIARKRATPRPVVNPSLRALFGWAFVLVLAALYVLGRVPSPVVVTYLSMSLAAFLAYAIDKSAAERNRWRTSENTLLALGLFGGWPGALLAQGKFRHKTRKAEFQFMFWISVLINCGALVWVLAGEGAEHIRALAG